MLPSKVFLLSGTGILAGVLIAIQSVLNAGLGQRAGNLGAVLMLTFVSAGGLILLILCFPATASFKNLPGASEWYLYLGGILGIAILAAPSCWSQGSARTWQEDKERLHLIDHDNLEEFADAVNQDALRL